MALFIYNKLCLYKRKMMQTLSIGEIQKNISLLTKITEVFTIVDKRRNQSVAVVYPIKKSNIVASLSGKYKDRVKYIDKIEEIKEKAMIEAIRDKYDLSN